MNFDNRSPRTFRAARGLAIFLSIGGILWTIVFVLNGYASADNWGAFVGIVIVALWLLRAFDIGSKPLWIFAWVLSVCWHLLWTLGGFGLAIVGVGTLGIPALGLAALPLIWVLVALACSVAGIVSDLEQSRPNATWPN
jgi:hypothetical protein